MSGCAHSISLRKSLYSVLLLRELQRKFQICPTRNIGSFSNFDLGAMILIQVPLCLCFVVSGLKEHEITLEGLTKGVFCSILIRTFVFSVSSGTWIQLEASYPNTAYLDFHIVRKVIREPQKDRMCLELESLKKVFFPLEALEQSIILQRIVCSIRLLD